MRTTAMDFLLVQRVQNNKDDQWNLYGNDKRKKMDGWKDSKIKVTENYAK